MKLDFINNNKQLVFGVDDALLAAGVSALAAGGQMYANSKMNKKAIKFNREMYDKQRADALLNFDRVNAYNTPEQQMRRMREAGLNPHLMYANGGSPSSAAPIGQAQAQVPELQTPNVQAMAAGPVNTYLEARSFQAQQKLVSAQTLKVLADVNKTNLSAENQATLNSYQGSILTEELVGKKIQNTAAELNINNATKKLESDIAQQAAQTLKTISDTELNSLVGQNLKSDLQTKESQRQFIAEQINQLEKDGKIKDFEIALNKAGFTKGDPVYARMAKTMLDAIGAGSLDGAKKVVEKAISELKTSKAGMLQTAFQTLISHMFTPSK